MIIRLNNKSKNFYYHLGRVFGSRHIERVTHDRFYDDDNKDWYIYFTKNKPVAFVSITNGVIKNVWGEREDYIVQTLQKIRADFVVKESVVTTAFREEYIKAGYVILDGSSKNFIRIRGDKIDT